MQNKFFLTSLITLGAFTSIFVLVWFYFGEVHIRNQEGVQIDARVSTIDMHGQNLQKVPEYIFTQIGIQKLDISNNQLTGAIPAEIRLL